MIVYHTTSKRNLESILQHGLIGGYTESPVSAIAASYDSRYGGRPIYVCVDAGYPVYVDDPIIIEIDATGLTLLPDYPTIDDDDPDNTGTYAIMGTIAPDRLRVYD